MNRGRKQDRNFEVSGEKSRAGGAAPAAAARNVGVVWLRSFEVRIQLSDEQFMREALALALEAEGSSEVPVGAVVVAEGMVIGRGRNAMMARLDPTAHAEILALREAASASLNYRLENATLYATLEPCVMCAGALVAARVRRLVFGARDLRFGAVRSKFRLADSELLSHRLEITEGVLAVECLEPIQRFFQSRRL